MKSYELSKDKIWIRDNQGNEVEFTHADLGILVQMFLEDFANEKINRIENRPTEENK